MARLDLRVIFFGFIGVMLLVHLPLLFVITHNHHIADPNHGGDAVTRARIDPAKLMPDVAVVGAGLEIGETDTPALTNNDKQGDDGDQPPESAPPSFLNPRIQRARDKFRWPRGDVDDLGLLPMEPRSAPTEWHHLQDLASAAVVHRHSEHEKLNTAAPQHVWPPALEHPPANEDNAAAPVELSVPKPPLPSFTIDESFLNPTNAEDAAVASDPSDAVVDASDLDLDVKLEHVQLTDAGTHSTGAVRGGHELSVLFFVGDASLCPKTLLKEIDQATPAGISTEVIVIGGDTECLKKAAMTAIHRVSQVVFQHIRVSSNDQPLDPRAGEQADTTKLGVVPNPWVILPLMLRLVGSPHFAFVGPSVSHVGPGLFRVLYETLKPTGAAVGGAAGLGAKQGQPAGGGGAAGAGGIPRFDPSQNGGRPGIMGIMGAPFQGPQIVGCTVRSAIVKESPVRAFTEYVVSRAVGVASNDDGNIAFDEHLAGYAAADSRASLLDHGVAPSPYCFAASTQSVNSYWPSAQQDNQRNAAGFPLTKEPQAFGFVPMSAGNDFEDHFRSKAAHPGSRDAHISVELHREFLLYALMAGSVAAHAAADAVAKSDAKIAALARHPVPCVAAYVVVRLPGWTPTGPSDRSMATVNPRGFIFFNDDATKAVHSWLSLAARPSDTIFADAVGEVAGPVAGAAPLGVMWDTFCIRCFGFSNELMHFAVPLEMRIPIKLGNSPDCFCPGTPRSFTSSLGRMSQNKPFVDRWKERKAAARNADDQQQQQQATTPAPLDATRPLIWISHKDPGSFPTYSYPGLRGRPDIVIGRAMYEFSKVPANWAGKDKIVDEIWVPSRYVRYVFEMAGYAKSKLFVMPEPLDVYQYDPNSVTPFQLPVRHLHWKYATNRPHKGKFWLNAVEDTTQTVVVPSGVAPLRRHFKFFSVFKWESRKAWDVLLRAYFREFKPDEPVSLYLVSYVYGGNGRDPEAMMSKARTVAEALHDGETAPSDGAAQWPRYVPHIEIVSEELSEAELISMYRSVDAFVLPTRGEGWGLPIIQAMSMGLPTIATNFSGNVDFMTNDTAYLLKVDSLAPLPAGSEYGSEPGKFWAEPSESHLRHLMRHVYANRREALMTGHRARAHIAKHYSDEAIAELVVQRLNALSTTYAEAHRAKRSGADALLFGQDKGLFP